MKTFNAFEKATIKNSAKAVAHYLAKNEKLDEKIKQLEAEKELNNSYIAQYTRPVVDLTGYQPLDLCEKVSRGSQMDWVFKYPNIIPDLPDIGVAMPAEYPETEKESEQYKVAQHAEQNEQSYPEEETLCNTSDYVGNDDTYIEENEEPASDGLDDETQPEIKPFKQEDWDLY